MTEKVVKKCHWCGNELHEKDIVKQGNARGYGYYIICDKCNNQNVIQEIDLTENFY